VQGARRLAEGARGQLDAAGRRWWRRGYCCSSNS